MNIPILYKDSYLVICVKPAGVISEDGGMPELLSPQCGGKRVYCVHRLDRETAGVMVYALNGKTAAKLSEMFSGGEVEKEYLAVLCGRVEENSGTYTDLLFHDKTKNRTYVVDRQRKGVKEASLDYVRLAESEYNDHPITLVRVGLHTGRSHQIRVQFSHRKLPLFGDKKYGSPFREGELALFARRLSFKHPETQKKLDFSRPLPTGEPWERFSSDAVI